MFKKLIFLLLVFTNFIFIMPLQLYAQDEKIDLTVRYGQGGFSDSRSPEGKLGGGQLALDIKLKELPIAINISTEFYTNGPAYDASHSYEITDMNIVNILYMSQLLDFKNTDYFFGGGLGRIKVPNDTDDSVKHYYTTVYNLEAGINFKYFEHIGFYSVAKHIRAEKTVNHTKVIDFNEKILLIGITFNFSMF